MARGPTSRKMRCPSPISWATASVKRTGQRTLRHQYSASSSSASTMWPVTVDTSRASGGCGARAAKIRQEARAEGVHCSRVEGEIQIERAEPNVAALQLGFQALD